MYENASRNRGITSLEKRSILPRVRSFGMSPKCVSASTKPWPRSFKYSVKRSRTVFALPTIQKPLSLSCLKLKFANPFHRSARQCCASRHALRNPAGKTAPIYGAGLFDTATRRAAPPRLPLTRLSRQHTPARDDPSDTAMPYSRNVRRARGSNQRTF
jgi:hypothetical protein